MKFSCVKMADEVVVGTSPPSKKAKTTFSEEKTEKLISFSSEEVLFNAAIKTI